jgi:glycosyltransferase involved in cell wall biosynthesis
MKITFEHAGILPVTHYGGTERIIYWLMKGLVEAGHEVNLISVAESSAVKNIGVNLIIRKNEDWREDIPAKTDIVHTFYTPKLSKFPHLVTIQGNGVPGEKFIKNTVFVSRKHAENHGAEAFVYNGLDLSEYPYVKKNNSTWNHFLFLAKASWKIKNLDGCVRACRQSSKHLEIAGGRWWGISRYIHSQGMVDQIKKNKLLDNCDALLFPVRWHEPFGIAVIEAMARGLPVIGSPYGSLPELITRDTGLIAGNFNELLEIVSRNKNTFNSDTIRSYVESSFSHVIMTQNYITYYQKVLKGESFNKNEPVATFKVRADAELLTF